MRICIIGAGAIGGYLGARLALAGETVTLIARGANLEAIRRDGLRLISGTTEEVARPAMATDDFRAAGPQDVVVAAVKAHQLADIALTLPALYDAQTIVVPAQNGIPWWYFQKHGGPYEGRRIKAVDPTGVLAEQIAVERIVGCVVYPAAELVAPGVVRHIEGNRFTLGELNGAKTERVQQLAQVLAQAGLKAPVRPRIRNEIWVKLWGNLAFNPISALTRATLAEIAGYPLTRQLTQAMMAEAESVGTALGVEFGVSIEQRIRGAAEVGEHKTSMLQDIEAGRRTEADALVGAVAELGRLVGVPVPHISAVYAAVKLLERKVIGDK
jgi:2-dehydropantoate 2-reductase